MLHRFEALSLATTINEWVTSILKCHLYYHMMYKIKGLFAKSFCKEYMNFEQNGLSRPNKRVT